MLDRCENLKELPKTIASSCTLYVKNLPYYKSIESLPTSIEDFKHWIELMLNTCENPKELS
jgi:hypothetical protein